MPFPSSDTWEFLLANRSNSVLADLSGQVLDPVVSPRLSTPSLQTWTLQATAAALSAGFVCGERRGIVKRNGTVVANDLLVRTKPAGGPTSGYMTAEFMGPMIEWTARYCQDVDGQIFDGPSADGTDKGMDLPAGIIADPFLEIGAGAILGEALANTIANDGALSVALGTFDTSIISAESWSFAMRNQSPLTVSELAAMFVEAGACDIVVAPHTTGSTQGTVSAVNFAGGSIAATFDYNTGSKNVAWAYPESDIDELTTKLWFELGLREGSHFKNNVTLSAPGVTVDPSARQTAVGVWHRIQMHPVWSGGIPTRFPSFDGETKPWTGGLNPLYQMYVQRYNAELGIKMWPRTKVRLEPQAGLAPEPWDDYNLGDIPTCNVVGLGIDLNAVPIRIIGWDTKPGRNGVARTELLIGWSPDA